MYELEVSPDRLSLKVSTDNARLIAKFQEAYPQHDEVSEEEGLLILTVYTKPGREFTPFPEEGAQKNE
jgi:hypothetical protein